MKFIIFRAIAVGLSLLAFFPFKEKPDNAEVYLKDLNNRKLAAVSCSPDLFNLRFSDEEIAAMIPLPGTGSHKWNISTRSDSAAFYFNQGMNLYYGFHIIEAVPSIKKAIQFDPDC